MAREIDERVVQMQFENDVFEKNIQTSIHSLNELKKGMNFDSAVNGFEKIDKASKGIKLDPLTAAVEALNSKFNLLGITAFNVMNRISNAAINTGISLTKSLSIDQITAGFTKYEQKTSSVQTIMSATAKQFTDTGEQMAYVNEQLDKLNWFTDETSYNFVDMVSNIGKFTANNIPLKEAVTSMQGIANWAAMSGANANEASRAMYNLSQALSSGSVKLMDWKSIELANMGTAQFKEAAIDAAVAAGSLTRGLDGIARTASGAEVSTTGFNMTLSEGWFTTEALIKVLDKYGGAANRLNAIYNETGVTSSSLVEGIRSYTDGAKTAEEVSEDWGIELEKTKGILEEFSTETMQFGLKAFDAAQEARTFADAIDATKDAVSTGWLKSFELIFGDYNQAKELWTELSEQLYDIFAGGTEARNEMLKAWQNAGGRDTIIDTIWAGLSAILRILYPIKAAWQDIFGMLDAPKLLKITEAINKFVLSLNLTKEQMQGLRSTFRGLFSILDILLTIFKGGLTIGLNAVRAVLKELNLDIFGFTGEIGNSITAFKDWFKEGNRFENIVTEISDSIVRAIHNIAKFVRSIGELDVVKNARSMFSASIISDIKSFADSFFVIDTKLEEVSEGVFKSVKDIRLNAEGMSSAFETMTNKISAYFGNIDFSLSGFTNLLSKGISEIQNLVNNFVSELGKSGSVIGKIAQNIVTWFNEIDWAGVTLLASGIVIIALLWKFAEAFEVVAKAIGNFGGVFGSLKDMFKSVGGYFDALKKNIQVNNIFKAALAISVLAVALSVLAHVDFKALAAGTGALILLMVALGGLVVVTNKFGKEGDQAKSIAGLVSIAGAIAILALALNAIKVDKTLPARLAIIGGALVAMFAIMKFSGGPEARSFVNASSILAMAVGIYIIVSALNKIKEIAPEDLATIIPVLSVIVIALAILGKVLNSGFVLDKGQSVKSAVNVLSILAMIFALKTVISAIKDLGKMDPMVLYSGVIAFIPIFVALLALSGAIRLAGDNMAKAGVFLLTLGISLRIMKGAIESLGDIDNSVAARGLSVIARLSLIFGALIAVSKFAGPHAAQVGVMMLGMAASLAIIQLAIKTLGKTDFLVLAKGVAAVTAVMLAFVPLVKAASGTFTADTTKALTKMAIIIGLFGIVIAGLSMLEPARALSATASLSAVILSLAAFFKLTDDIKPPKAKEFIKIIAFVGLMSSILAILGAITDPVGVLAVATAMSEVLLALSAAGVIMKKGGVPSEANAKAMRVFVISVGGIIAALAAIVGIVNAVGGSMKGMLTLTTSMSEVLISLALAGRIMDKTKNPSIYNTRAMNQWVISVGSLIAGLAIIQAVINGFGGSIDGILLLTTGMSEILLSLAVAARIIGKEKIEVPKSTALVALGAMVAAIGGIVALFSNWSDPAKVVPYAIAISEVVLALSAAVKILSLGVGVIDPSTMSMMAILTGLTTVMGIVLASMSSMVDPITVLPIATGMSAIMLALAGVVKIISMTPPAFLTGAWASLGMMATIVGALGVLGIALGALYQIPAFQSILNDSGAAMTAFGQAIGGFFGGIVGGFVGGAIEGVLDLIPSIGEKLTAFMVSATPGFALMKSTAGGLLSAAAEVAAAILVFTAADFLSGIAGFLGSVFGTKDDGLAERFTTFGNALVAFSDSLGEDFDAENVKAAAEAGKALAELENNLPRQGGKLQVWLGSNTLDTFGGRIRTFGAAIAAFSDVVTGKDGGPAVNKKAVEAATNAGKMLAGLEESIPAQGGKLQVWLGSKTLDTFGMRIRTFASAIVTFSDTVTGKDGGSAINEDAVQAAIDAGKLLTALEQGIPPQDGILQTFLGSKSLDDFGTRLGKLGTALVTFGEDTEGLKASNITVAASALRTLVDLENGIETSGGLGSIFFGESSFSSFGANLKDLGGALFDYDQKIKDVNLAKVNSMNTSLTSLLNIAARATSVGGQFASLGGNLRAFASNLNTYSTSATNADTDSMTAVKVAIEDLLRLSEFTNAQQWLNDIISMAKNMIAQIQVNVSEQFGKIRKSGKDLAYWFVQGFKSGINENSEDAKNAAISLAATVDQAVRDKLEIASPSAVMAEEGKWVVRGLAEGISNDTSAEEAASKKAQNIVNAFQEVLSIISTKSTRADLEYKLWEQTEGFRASDADKNTKQLSMKAEQLKLSADQVKAQKATLDALKKTVGESSKEYNDAYNTYLQGMISMYEKKHEIDQMTAVEEKSDREKMIIYAKTRKEYAEAFKMLGWSELEQEAFARQKAGYGNEQMVGYGIEQLKQDMVDTNAIIAGALSDQSASIEQSVAKSAVNAVTKGLGAAVPQARDVGKNVTEGLAEGILNSEAVAKGKEAISQVIGWRDMPGVGLLGTAAEEAGVQSPSKYTREIGIFITQGLALGISDPAAVSQVNNATRMVSSATINAFRSSLPQFEYIGRQAMSGFKTGIEIVGAQAIAAARAIAAQVAAAMSGVLQVHSPSRVTMAIGKNVSLGLANGILDNADSVSNASEVLANKTLAVLDETKSAINAIIESDDAFSPTITPVLDMDMVKQQARGISGLLGNKSTLQLGAINARVGTIAASYQGNSQNGSHPVLASNNYSFVQNNYSPKPLNRAEIYRNTKNQFAQLKGVTGRK